MWIHLCESKGWGSKGGMKERYGRVRLAGQTTHIATAWWHLCQYTHFLFSLILSQPSLGICQKKKKAVNILSLHTHSLPDLKTPLLAFTSLIGVRIQKKSPNTSQKASKVNDWLDSLILFRLKKANFSRKISVK